MQKSQKLPASPINSFDFIAEPNAKVLILGSMPGVASLQEKQYYAHPRNHFWPIMQSLFANESDYSNLYEKRLQVLKDKRIALWDVLAECERKGSLDNDIDTKTIKLNDFASLFLYAPEIEAIFFNGKTAEKLFRQHIIKKNRLSLPNFRLIGLPSTSPAYAKMGFEEKLSHWEKVKKQINLLKSDK